MDYYIDFRRQNLTSTDVRFWRLMSIPALQGLNPRVPYYRIQGHWYNSDLYPTNITVYTEAFFDINAIFA